jgi:hypothetical protein
MVAVARIALAEVPCSAVFNPVGTGYFDIFIAPEETVKRTYR